LYLNQNQINDIQPLVDNSGIDSGDSVSLYNNPLSLYSQETLIPILEGRGVTVDYAEGTEVNILDPNLEAVIREAINKPEGPITDVDLQGINDLHGTSRGIADLTGLEYCINLQWLHLDTNQISDISAVSGLTKLVRLRLGGNQISDISAVSGLTNLTDLTLNNNQISDISAVSGLTKLVSLSLSTNQISDISYLANLTNLTHLNLDVIQISDGDISVLSGLTKLELLALGGNQPQIIDISALSGLTNLQLLSLGWNEIIDISALAGMTDLQVLNLCWNQIIDISALAGLTNLQQLHLHSNLTISDISALDELTNLQQLYLGQNQIIDISALAGLTELQLLELWWNQISDISALAGLTNLQQLHLHQNQINDIQPLVDNSGIDSGDSVSLYNNPLSYTSQETLIPTLGGRGVTVDYRAQDVVALDSVGPPTWSYTLTHQDGYVYNWFYKGTDITGASVTGEAAAAGWTVEYSSTLVTFSNSTPLTEGSVSGFEITGAEGGMDNDVDGVSNLVEDGAPNGGDGNNDGIVDKQQDNVTSLPNAVDGTYVPLSSPDETSLADVQAIENPSPDDSPSGVEFPIGFLDFTVQRIEPGDSTTVTIFLPPNTTVSAYYKYGPTPNNPLAHWYNFSFDGTTGAEILDDNSDGSTDRIVLHLVDGLRGDDDRTENGKIVDPGAPAISTSLLPEDFKYALFGNTGKLVINGKATVLGDVFNNGDAEIKKGASIDGFLFCTGKVKGEGSYNLGPLPEPLPELPILSTTPYDAMLYRASFQPKDNMEVSDSFDLAGRTLLVNGNFVLKKDGTITGTGIIVAAKDIKIEDDSTIGEGVTLIAGKKMEIKKGVVADNINNVFFSVKEITIKEETQISGALLSLGDIEIKKRSNFSGIMYAAGKVKIEKESSIEGSIVANELEGVKKDTTITFNEAMTQEIGAKILFVEGEKPAPAPVVPALVKVIKGKSKLAQNYPNPFNPETWIPYTLTDGSDVTIQIYNVAGILIRTLDLGYKDAGYYLERNKAAYWDGRNELGEQIASGVYFYVMQSGSFRATRKMAIIR